MANGPLTEQQLAEYSGLADVVVETWEARLEARKLDRDNFEKHGKITELALDAGDACAEATTQYADFAYKNIIPLINEHGLAPLKQVKDIEQRVDDVIAKTKRS